MNSKGINTGWRKLLIGTIKIVLQISTKARHYNIREEDVVFFLRS
jgi:hypothetical protein